MTKSLIAQAEINIANQAKDQGIPGADAATTQIGFAQFIANMMSVAMTVGALALLLYLIWGAIEWITAGGDSGKIQKARDKITQGVIGLIVLGAATTIFAFVQEFLGVCIIDIGGACTLETTTN